MKVDRLLPRAALKENRHDVGRDARRSGVRARFGTMGARWLGWCPGVGRVGFVMFNFIFDLPLLVSGALIVGLLVLYALFGIVIVRRWLLPRLRVQPADSEFSGAMLQAVMVFYGLALALIAINVWQTYSDVSKITSQEASAMASLYRDVSGYPEPIRTEMRGQLADYTEYVIEKAWPLQSRGEVPGGGVELMNRLQGELFAFEPTTRGQEILHAETLRAYNHMMLARRLRLDAVGTHLPTVL